MCPTHHIRCCTRVHICAIIIRSISLVHSCEYNIQYVLSNIIMYEWSYRKISHRPVYNHVIKESHEILQHPLTRSSNQVSEIVMNERSLLIFGHLIINSLYRDYCGSSCNNIVNNYGSIRSSSHCWTKRRDLKRDVVLCKSRYINYLKEVWRFNLSVGVCVCWAWSN